MYKKILLISMFSFLLIVLTSRANQISHTGFSIGYNLGYESLSGKFDYHSSINGKIQTVSEVGTTTPTIGFFIGYGFEPFPSNIYFGCEVFAQYENIHQKNKIAYKETIFKSTNCFGLVAKTGYFIDDYLFFLKTGVVTMNKIKKDISPRKTGFLMGLGIDYGINPNWAIGTELVFESYGPINIRLNELSIALLGDLIYKPKKYTSNIRLKYTF